MADTEEKIKELASLAYHSLERVKRDDGTEFTRIKDDAPSWIRDLCYVAHANMMPDDWRYIFIEEVLGSIADSDDIDDVRDELEPDVYNTDRLQWLSSSLYRAEYVDDAVNDFGWPDDGLYTAIGMGQVAEKREVLDAVYGYLEALAEDGE